MTIRAVVVFATVLFGTMGAAEASTYSADRYDSRVEVLRGGAIRVTETVTLRFEDGTFSQFYRVIPTRLTDGVEIVSASMDDHVMPTGKGSGHVEISGSSRVRVTWRFAPLSNASHTFELTYLVRGTVRQEDGADVFAWTILPTEHAYRIASSTTEILLPAQPATPPKIDARRVGDSIVAVDGSHVRINATAIRANGWLEAWIRLPPGSAIDTPPAWQQRQVEVRQFSVRWISAAGLVLFSGLALLFAVRQGYDSPPADLPPSTTWSTPPDTLMPALAGTLVTNGSAQLEHSLAAMFSLADRGELRIDEQPRRFGQAQFAITRTPTGRPLAPFEQRLLDIIFTDRQGTASSVGLARTRNRLMGQSRNFSKALEPALQSAGLLDEDRRRVRARFIRIAIASGVGAGIASIVCSFFADRYDGWPMLIPAAFALVALVALICYAAHTPLSNDGVRRAQQWVRFRRYLRDVARDREPSPSEADARRLLPFAVALGVAPAWSAYLKRHRWAAPTWFRAASDARGHSGASFATFVSTGGSGSGGGAHGGGGGGAAAGGGASGAS